MMDGYVIKDVSGSAITSFLHVRACITIAIGGLGSRDLSVSTRP